MEQPQTERRVPSLRTRLLLGSLAGISGTLAMTIGMRHLHRRLPEGEQYPLPPREITERSVGSISEESLRDLTLAAHFGYGAGSGVLLASWLRPPGAGTGAAMGAAIWAASYFGWIPALGLLRPASSHPWQRNLLMFGVHLLWGAATAQALNELTAARATIVADGPLGDAKTSVSEGQTGSSK